MIRDPQQLQLLRIVPECGVAPRSVVGYSYIAANCFHSCIDTAPEDRVQPSHSCSPAESAETIGYPDNMNGTVLIPGSDPGCLHICVAILVVATFGIFLLIAEPESQMQKRICVGSYHGDVQPELSTTIPGRVKPKISSFRRKFYKKRPKMSIKLAKNCQFVLTEQRYWQ